MMVVWKVVSTVVKLAVSLVDWMVDETVALKAAYWEMTMAH